MMIVAPVRGGCGMAAKPAMAIMVRVEEVEEW